MRGTAWLPRTLLNWSNARCQSRWRSSTARSLFLILSTSHCRPSRKPSPVRADTSCTLHPAPPLFTALG